MSAPVPGCPNCEALPARVSELEALVARLEALVIRQQAQVEELTARLNQNSGNSSQPPSADTAADRAQRPQPPPSGRKPGGQKGHCGSTRCDFPPAAVDRTVACVPTQCGGCGAVLPAAAASGDPEPRRHQVGELPPLRLHVTEYHLHGRCCPGCGKVTWGILDHQGQRHGFKTGPGSPDSKLIPQVPNIQRPAVLAPGAVLDPGTAFVVSVVRSEAEDE